jgi:hypothetical protein
VLPIHFTAFKQHLRLSFGHLESYCPSGFVVKTQHNHDFIYPAVVAIPHATSSFIS